MQRRREKPNYKKIVDRVAIISLVIDSPAYFTVSSKTNSKVEVEHLLHPF